MNRMKGKGIAAFLLSAVVFLSGCGGASTPPAESKTATATATPTATATAAPADNATGMDLPKPNANGTIVMEAVDMSRQPEAAKARKDTLIIGTTDFNGKFNHVFWDSAYDKMVTDLEFDAAVGATADAKAVDDRMTTYTISEDQKTYTFKLKDGIKYFDGTEVTAKDLEFTYFILADPTYDGNSDLAPAKILGYKEYKEGDATSIEGIKVVDDKTLSITMEEPFAPAIWTFNEAPTPKAYYDPDFKKGDLSKIKAKMATPMGAGPYHVTEFKEGESVHMVANEHYYRGAPKIKNLIFKVVSQDTQNQEMTSGTIDMLNYDVTQDNVELFQGEGFLSQQFYPNNGYGYVALVEKFDVWKDPKVRQAFAHAIDRANVVKQIYGPFGRTLDIPQSPVSWAFTKDDVITYDYDLKKAAALLEEAGYKKNANGIYEKDGKELTIDFAGMQPHTILDIMIPQLTASLKELGVKFNPEYFDFPALLEKTEKEDVQTYFLAWGLTADPDSGRQTFTTTGTQNKYGYSNPEVDKLYDDATRVSDYKERAAIYAKIYQKLNHDLPLIPIYQRSDGWVINGRVKGFDLSPYITLADQVYNATISE